MTSISTATPSRSVSNKYFSPSISDASIAPHAYWYGESHLSHRIAAGTLSMLTRNPPNIAERSSKNVDTSVATAREGDAVATSAHAAAHAEAKKRQDSEEREELPRALAEAHHVVQDGGVARRGRHAERRDVHREVRGDVRPGAVDARADVPRARRRVGGVPVRGGDAGEAEEDEGEEESPGAVLEPGEVVRRAEVQRPQDERRERRD